MPSGRFYLIEDLWGFIVIYFCRDKLAAMKLSRYKDDLLFFMFYNSVGDVLQIAAATEL